MRQEKEILQPEAATPADYARAYLEERLGDNEAAHLEACADLETYGRGLMRRNGVVRTSYGMLGNSSGNVQLTFNQKLPVITLKFYSPLLIRTFPKDEYGYEANAMEPVDDETDILSCKEQIQVALKRAQIRLDYNHGLMECFDGSKSVQDKAVRLFFDIEEQEGTLWGVTKIGVRAPLTGCELNELLEFAEGQMSDGLGEEFEQRPVITPEGELYVSLWNPDNFHMVPEDVFEPERYYDYSGGMKL